MKSLIAGVVLIIILGVGAYFYSAVINKDGDAIACTMDARICPDGTGVGRSGPKCEFAPCLPPNAEDKEIGLAFAIPAGYVSNGDVIGAEPTLRVVLEDLTSSILPLSSIIIRAFPIEEGKTANDTIIAHTRFKTSDLPATSMSQFKTRIVGEHTFNYVVVERFEGHIDSIYYLPREKDVLSFEVLERNLTEDWMSPTLVIENLPAHQALLNLLSTLQVSE